MVLLLIASLIPACVYYTCRGRGRASVLTGGGALLEHMGKPWKGSEWTFNPETWEALVMGDRRQSWGALGVKEEKSAEERIILKIILGLG